MSYQVDQVIFCITVPGSSRQAIALFSEATEDPNPIHVDEAFANSCGFPEVIQQGPMTTAHFANLLVKEFGVSRLKMLDVSFTAPVFPQELLILSARVVAVDKVVHLELEAKKQDGTQTAKGVAMVVNVGESA